MSHLELFLLGFKFVYVCVYLGGGRGGACMWTNVWFHAQGNQRISWTLCVLVCVYLCLDVLANILHEKGWQHSIQTNIRCILDTCDRSSVQLHSPFPKTCPQQTTITHLTTLSHELIGVSCLSLFIFSNPGLSANCIGTGPVAGSSLISAEVRFTV